MERMVIVQYLVWHFWDVPKKITLAWRNFIWFIFNYFSILLLVKTLFYPWRKYMWDYQKGFDIKRFLETLSSNLISRIFGAIVRLLVIFVGLLAEGVVLGLGVVVLAGWLVLPVVVVYGFIFGLKIIL